MTIKIKYGAVLLATSAFLAGCSGFWDLPPTTTTTTTTTPTTLSSGIFYVLNRNTKQVVGYSINSGSLNQISGATQTFAAEPYCFAVAPSGGFLYVSVAGSGIYLFTVDSGGGLTEANGGGTISGDIPYTMQVDPSGSWLVDASPTVSVGLQVDAIPITTSGTLDTSRTEQIPNNLPSFTNASPNGMAISPDGKNVFVAAGLAGTVVIPFSAGSASPLATSGSSTLTISPLHSPGSDLSVAVDPTDRLFYIGETDVYPSSANPGGLRVFNYSSLSGTLTQASGSPIASGGLSPNAILPEASGDYVYVANGQGETGAGNIAWFPITASGTTYSIASGSTIAAGIFPVGLAEDSDDNFVLAVSTGGTTSSGDPDLEAYTMSSGALTAAITSATGTDPVGAVAVAALP